MRPLVVLTLLALALPVCAQDVAHSQAATAALVDGVEAFKAGHYEEATLDFQSAVDTEPNWRTARVYLGTALSYQVVPNLDTPENVAMAGRALNQFNQLLATDPQDLDALRQVASIQRNIKRFDDALATERTIIAIDPNDAEAHYTIGVIEWTNAYKFAVLMLGQDSLQDDGNGNTRMSPASCTSLISNNTALVNDGIAQLTRAVELRPTYGDAMQYLNLMYRRRADLDCTNPTLREKDLETANEWVRRAMDARKVNEQHREQQVGGSSNR
jgi:tetratricopeptide (TPR) repeat protein